MPSTPAIDKATARTGSLHVQTLTRMPASWLRSISSAVTVGSHGCSAV
jgi:hypothetical protein